MNSNSKAISISPHGKSPRGRGAGSNRTGRFESTKILLNEDIANEGLNPAGKYYTDNSKSILSKNDSPDIPFEWGLNPYRGCEHGCVYCYARPTHEYLGFSSGLDFESRIFIKHKAPELLEKKLSSRSWKPSPIAISGNTDAYQPLEKKWELTRKCLGVLQRWGNPALLITKNFLVTRDIDILQRMAYQSTVSVMVSLTTLNDGLRKSMEPRTSSPTLRLKAIEKLSEAGIPVGVLIGPVIPGLTDHEIPALLEQARAAGARRAGYIMLRLPYSVKDLFKEWLENYYPQSAVKILHQIQSVRGGALNDASFGRRMKGSGILASQIASLFKITCEKLSLSTSPAPLSVSAFKHPGGDQLTLF